MSMFRQLSPCLLIATLLIASMLMCAPGSRVLDAQPQPASPGDEGSDRGDADLEAGGDTAEVEAFTLTPYVNAEVGDTVIRTDILNGSSTVTYGGGQGQQDATEMQTAAVSTDRTVDVVLEVTEAYVVLARTYEVAEMEMTITTTRKPAGAPAQTTENTATAHRGWEGKTIVLQVFLDGSGAEVIDDEPELEGMAVQLLVLLDAIVWWSYGRDWVLDESVELSAELLQGEFSSMIDLLAGDEETAFEASIVLTHLGPHEDYEAPESVAVLESLETFVIGTSTDTYVRTFVFDTESGALVHARVETESVDSDEEFGSSSEQAQTSTFEATEVTDEELQALRDAHPYSVLAGRRSTPEIRLGGHVEPDPDSDSEDE